MTRPILPPIALALTLLGPAVEAQSYCGTVTGTCAGGATPAGSVSARGDGIASGVALDEIERILV